MVLKNSNNFWRDLFWTYFAYAAFWIWMLLFDFLLLCVLFLSGACFNRTTTTFDGSQKGTEAGWQRWPWHDSKLTERETVDCDGRCCCCRCCCLLLLSLLLRWRRYLRTHIHIQPHTHSNSIQQLRERERGARVGCLHTRAWYSWRLSWVRAPSLSLPLALALFLLLICSLAWFISVRSVCLVFIWCVKGRRRAST